MKISIDTATDSKEDIRKAIRLLQSIVEHEGSASRDIFSAPGAGLFGDSQPAAAEPASNPVTAFGSLFGDNAPAQQSQSTMIPEEKKEKQPQVEFY